MENISPSSFLFRGREKFRKSKSNHSGNQIDYLCLYYQPHFTSNSAAVNRVKRIKSVKEEDKDFIMGMIDESIQRLEMFTWKADGIVLYPENFDLIIPAPSNFQLNNLISNRMVYSSLSKRGHKLENIASGLMEKRLFSELLLNREILTREHNPNTNSLIESYLDVINKWHGQTFEVKKIKASLRRYIYNFLRLNVNHPSYRNLLMAKRILILDDTIGETITISEMARVIHQINKHVTINAFSLVRDFPSSTKSVNCWTLSGEKWYLGLQTCPME